MFRLFKKKPATDTLPLLVDIHSHLLPGIDDGVKSVEETAYILKALQNLGYKKAITTPHVMSDHYPNSDTEILKSLKETKSYLKDLELEIELEAAAEYFLDENLISRLSKKEKLLTFGDNYLLFETSFYSKPAFLEEAIFNMRAQGYQPILAHPERYNYLQGNRKLLDKLKNMGLMLQLNMLSLSGFYSINTKKFAIKLLKDNMIDFIGTDCHSPLQIDEIKKKLKHIDCKYFSAPNIRNQSLL